MAAKLLERFGQEALKPRLVEGVWRKAAISAKNAASLRKQALLEGREWPYEEDKAVKARRKNKGHKFDKLKPVREAEIAKNLEDMPNRVAQYREAQQLKDESLFDRLTMTPKQRRLKQKGKSAS